MRLTRSAPTCSGRSSGPARWSRRWGASSSAPVRALRRAAEGARALGRRPCAALRSTVLCSACRVQQVREAGQAGQEVEEEGRKRLVAAAAAAGAAGLGAGAGARGLLALGQVARRPETAPTPGRRATNSSSSSSRRRGRTCTRRRPPVRGRVACFFSFSLRTLGRKGGVALLRRVSLSSPVERSHGVARCRRRRRGAGPLCSVAALMHFVPLSTRWWLRVACCRRRWCGAGPLPRVLRPGPRAAARRPRRRRRLGHPVPRRQRLHPVRLLRSNECLPACCSARTPAATNVPAQRWRNVGRA